MQLAVSPNSAEIHVYSTVPASEPGRWERTAVLREHDQVVCSLDWARGSGKLLSCSHDRNVYVWTPPCEPGGAWAPQLVVHGLNRAALCCSWAPSERKFAVGSGAGALAVCCYEAENDWWVGKLVKRHHAASLLCVAWHPTQPLLATACADGVVRVLAAAVRGVDSAPVGGEAKFGDVLLSVDVGGGWAHCVAWAPRGDALAFLTHAGGAHFLGGLQCDRAGQWGGGAAAAAAPQAVPLGPSSLPALSIAFLSDTTAIAAGFDCAPLLLARTLQGWQLAGEVAAAEDGAPGCDKKSAFSERLASFKSQTERGEAPPGGDADAPATGAPQGLHQNTITCVRAMPGLDGGFSTSGTDGRLAVWSAAPSELTRLGFGALTLA